MSTHIDRQKYKGTPDDDTNDNCILMGNSGVGKTTFIKKVLYPALEKIGVLTGKFVTVSARQLLHNGLQEKMNEAKDGMLFLDEAYAATGCAALTTAIVNNVSKEQRGTCILVVAGYRKEMVEWMGKNQGLAARFTHTLDFPNYTAEQLVRIGERFVREKTGFTFADDVGATLQAAAEHVTTIRPGTTRANADAIRFIVRQAIRAFRERRQAGPDGGSMAQELIAADIDAGLKKLQTSSAGAAGMEHMVSSSSSAGGGGSSHGDTDPHVCSLGSSNLRASALERHLQKIHAVLLFFGRLCALRL